VGLRSSLFLVCLIVATLTLNAQNVPTGSNATTKATNDRSKTVPVTPEAVLVTGTFAPVPQTEVDRSVTIIDTDGQDLLYNNWVDYLELSPSVDFRERAPADVQGDLTIRGSTFGQTLVLVDGLRMNDVQTAHHDMDLPLPTDSVKRIEVLRGAGSTLYGSEAMAGTVNVITNQPERADARVGASVGNFGVNEQNGSISLLWRKLDTQLDAERDFSSGFRPDRDYRNLSLFSSRRANRDRSFAAHACLCR
jgi:iron complex outermembrane recepter protein